MLIWNSTTLQQCAAAFQQAHMHLTRDHCRRLTQAYHHKQAAEPQATAALVGTLYLSRSGWLLLSVPNAVVRGLFDALHEPGTELPSNSSGNLEAHISVMTPADVEQAGGADKISERGHQFRYQLGAVKTVRPRGQSKFSAVWFVAVKSSELEQLRKSYGLSATPYGGDHEFHITFAYRKLRVLQNNDVTKAAAVRIERISITLDRPSLFDGYGEDEAPCAEEDLSPEQSEQADALQDLGQDEDDGIDELDLQDLDDAVDAVWDDGDYDSDGEDDEVEDEDKTAECHHHPQPPSIKNRQGEDVDICPHCAQPLEDKDIYTDRKGWMFCRKCFRKGKGAVRLPVKEAKFQFNTPRNLNSVSPRESLQKEIVTLSGLQQPSLSLPSPFIGLPALGAAAGWALESSQPDETYWKRKGRSVLHGLAGGLGAAAGQHLAGAASGDMGTRIGGGVAGSVLAYLLARAVLPAQDTLVGTGEDR